MTIPKHSDSKHTDSRTGPATNLSAVYCGQIDAAMKAAEPMLRAIGRTNLEWSRLATQRTRAWVSLPAQATRCKSPADLFSLQMQFWQTAAQNYMEGMQRMLSAASKLSPIPQEAEARAGGHDFLQVRDEPQPAESKHRSARQAA